MFTPNSSAKPFQTSMLASESLTLTSVENCILMPPAERAVLPIPSDPFSTSVTFAPRSASACAEESPTIPPPTTTTSISPDTRRHG